jgi:hypothetical protein
MNGMIENPEGIEPFYQRNVNLFVQILLESLFPIDHLNDLLQHIQSFRYSGHC